MLQRLLHALLWGPPYTYSFTPLVRICNCGAYSMNGYHPTMHCPSLLHEHKQLKRVR